MVAVGTLFQLPETFFLEARPESHATADPKPSSALAETGQVGGAAPAGTSEATSSNTRSTQEEQPSTIAGRTATAACHTCSTGAGSSLTFESYAEQREHFKSDWHRFNIKRKLASRAALDEEEFERFLGENEEVSSISGSESEDEEDGPSTSGRQVSSRGAQLVFVAPDGRRLALWRSVLGPDGKAGASAQQLTEALKALWRDAAVWIVVLSRGGHFAAAVFDCRLQQGAASQVPKGANAPLFSVLAHKTFHRYVVRQGQGGRQSGKDATGKYAKSAGSQIRRHNEAALDREILEVFRAWAGHLAGASRIFLAAPGANGAVLFTGKDAPLQRTDPRICGIPFTTRRPTFGEAKRVLQTLLTVSEPVEVTPVPPAAKKVPKTQPAKPAAVIPDPEPAQQPPPPPEPALHRLARAGDAERVQALLEEGHDPTVTNASGKTAYAVAAEKGVRDVFRRRMAAEPQQWDWAAAGVPSALTAEMESQQAAREAEKKARLKEKEKERKKRAAERKKRAEAGAMADAEGEINAAAAEAAAIAARSKDGKDARSKVQSRSEAEMRRKREQMAAAAEARMAALQLASQQQQLWRRDG